MTRHVVFVIALAMMHTSCASRSSEAAADATLPPTQGGFVAYTEKPILTNTEQVRQTMQREYPARLRDARIGGCTLLRLLVSERGRVDKTTVRKSSGQAQLDRAAARVARIMVFTPGKLHEKPIPVWIDVPVLFTTTGTSAC
jgi:TonB family protein